MIERATSVNSKAEDIFVQLFCEAFGPHNADNLYVQYPFVDIYGGHRYIDFALANQEMKIAIEIDGETYHNPKNISQNKYFDDLLKQNSLIYDNWKVYRWAYAQLKNYPDKIKDELLTFLGETPFFKSFIDQNFYPSRKVRRKSLLTTFGQRRQPENIQAEKKIRKQKWCLLLSKHFQNILENLHLKTLTT